MVVTCSIGGRLYAVCPKYTPISGNPPALVEYVRRHHILVGYASHDLRPRGAPATLRGVGRRLVRRRAGGAPDPRRAGGRPRAGAPHDRARGAQSRSIRRRSARSGGWRRPSGSVPLRSCSNRTRGVRRCHDPETEPYALSELTQEAVAAPDVSLFGYSTAAAALEARDGMQASAPGATGSSPGARSSSPGAPIISSLLRSTLGVPVNGFQPNPGIAPALYNGYESLPSPGLRAGAAPGGAAGSIACRVAGRASSSTRARHGASEASRRRSARGRFRARTPSASRSSRATPRAPASPARHRAPGHANSTRSRADDGHSESWSRYDAHRSAGRSGTRGSWCPMAPRPCVPCPRTATATAQTSSPARPPAGR